MWAKKVIWKLKKLDQNCTQKTWEKWDEELFCEEFVGFFKARFCQKKKTHFNWLWYQKNWENLSEKGFFSSV